MGRPLRFGTLGAAKIAPAALIEPCQQGPEAEVVLVAARDRARAEAFAARHGIPRVADDYRAVIEDPDIDAVYNPLPMSLHAHWSIAALQAGKHVLCEKPFAANAREAQMMVQAAEQSGRVLIEALHYRYHPYFERILGLIQSGRLGALRHVEGRFTTSIPDTTDLRHQFATAGGATMDLGCYALHWLRQVVGEEPRAVRAEARVGNPHIDLSMTAELQFPSGVSGRMHCSMAADERFADSLRVEGTEGCLEADNPMAPQLGHQLRLRVGDQETSEQVNAGTSYRHQLVAFVAAVRAGRDLPTGGADAVANMRLIDAIYQAAGLPLRGQAA